MFYVKVFFTSLSLNEKQTYLMKAYWIILSRETMSIPEYLNQKDYLSSSNFNRYYAQFRPMP